MKSPLYTYRCARRAAAQLLKKQQLQNHSLARLGWPGCCWCLPRSIAVAVTAPLRGAAKLRIQLYALLRVGFPSYAYSPGRLIGSARKFFFLSIAASTYRSTVHIMFDVPIIVRT